MTTEIEYALNPLLYEIELHFCPIADGLNGPRQKEFDQFKSVLIEATADLVERRGLNLDQLRELLLTGNVFSTF